MLIIYSEKSSLINWFCWAVLITVVRYQNNNDIISKLDEFLKTTLTGLVLLIDYCFVYLLLKLRHQKEVKIILVIIGLFNQSLDLSQLEILTQEFVYNSLQETRSVRRSAPPSLDLTTNQSIIMRCWEISVAKCLVGKCQFDEWFRRKIVETALFPPHLRLCLIYSIFLPRMMS